MRVETFYPGDERRGQSFRESERRCQSGGCTSTERSKSAEHWLKLAAEAEAEGNHESASTRLAIALEYENNAAELRRCEENERSAMAAFHYRRGQ
jgi:hypothetical protein